MTASHNPDSPAKSEYLLLVRNTQLEKRLAPDELEEAMEHFTAWYQRWTDSGHIKGGQPLGDTGKVISGAKTRTIADGPFAESKEAVGGYILVQTSSFEEAVKIAEDWPLIRYDGIIEVRPVLALCASMALIRERQEAAASA